jgi:hypothetical protein
MTPVMYSDISGYKPTSDQVTKAMIIGGAVLGVFLIAIGIGGVAGGYLLSVSVNAAIMGTMNEANGGSYVDGAIAGAVLGLAFGVAGSSGAAGFAAVEAGGLIGIGGLAAGLSGSILVVASGKIVSNAILDDLNGTNTSRYDMRSMAFEYGVYGLYTGFYNGLSSTTSKIKPGASPYSALAATISVTGEVVIDVVQWVVNQVGRE